MATVPLSSDAAKAFTLSDLSPPLLHALAVAAKKPAADCRSDLAPGRYDIDAAVSVRGVLTVGEDTITASSVTPQPEQLLAHILGKLNAATRDKLLRELPEDFSANGNEMPQGEESLVEAVREMLTKLRRRVTRPRRGSVSGTFDMKVVPALVMSKLSVVG
jgi:hypothetical protein